MIFVKIALALFLTTGVMPSWYADEASQVSESPQQIVRELASLYEVDPDLAVEMVRLECDWDQEAVGDSEIGRAHV